jgi:hypothetical protein
MKNHKFPGLTPSSAKLKKDTSTLTSVFILKYIGDYSNALPGALTHITMTQICVPKENIFSQLC